MSGVYFNPFDGKLFTVPQKIGKADSPTFANLTLTGDLIVSGNSTTTADLFVEDKTITLAFGSASAALSDGAGIIIDGANIKFLYDHSETAMTLNSDLLPEANATFDIGSSGLRWKDGWYSATVTANTFAGDLISSSVTITGGTISNTTIGATNPTTGAFTTVSASGQITSTVTTGTAPLVIASTTQVANLNASQLISGTWAAPGTIGSTTANTGAFTALTATTLRTADGSAAAPAHSFTNKTTTGAFLTTNSTYAISVEGTKTVEFGVAAQGDSLLEIYDEDDELIFAVNPLDTNQPILQVLNAVGDVLIDASANSVTIGKDTDIDGVLTFANGSIVNVVSDLAAGESANSAAIVSNIIRIDQGDYDSLVSPDPDTLYVIV
jgi:hypothetical protein